MADRPGLSRKANAHYLVLEKANAPNRWHSFVSVPREPLLEPHRTGRRSTGRQDRRSNRFCRAVPEL